MAYIVTPLGLRLADPATVQAFETTVVNSNFTLLDTAVGSLQTLVAALQSPTLIRGRMRVSSDQNIGDQSSPRTRPTMVFDSAFSQGMTASGSALVVPKTGEYWVQAAPQWGQGAGTRLLSIFVNGAETSDGIIDSRQAGSTGIYVTIMKKLQFTTGQLVTMGVAQNSGGSLALTAGADFRMWFANTL